MHICGALYCSTVLCMFLAARNLIILRFDSRTSFKFANLIVLRFDLCTSFKFASLMPLCITSLTQCQNLLLYVFHVVFQ